MIVDTFFYCDNIVMSYVKYNENPCGKFTTDCTVRALSTLMNERWDVVYLQLCLIGLTMCEMPSTKAVIHEYLRRNGYLRYTIPNRYPADYSVRDFAEDHKYGTYLLTTDSHVVPVIDGCWIDNWDSAEEIILFYWTKGAVEDAI